MQDLLEGKSGEVPTRLCDVRDVARAHIKAMEDPTVQGRVIVSTRNMVPTKDIVAMLRQRFPQFKLQDGADGDRQQIMDNSKVQLAYTFPSDISNIQGRHFVVTNTPIPGSSRPLPKSFVT